MRLIKFLVRRSLQGLLVVWGVVTITFLLRVVTPGDPIDLIVDPGTSPDTREQIREDFGLNEPLHEQYIDYLLQLVTGDLGYSFQERRDVAAIIIERLPATIELAIAATIVALVIAIPLGVIAATRRQQPADYAATTFSLLGISTPNFWLGVMLIMIFAVQLGIFPTSGRPVGLWESIVSLTSGDIVPIIQWTNYIILPAITLGTYFTALITRLTRSGMLEELGQPYVTATEAKGLPGVLIRYKHVLRNTMIPILTVLGLQLGTLIGGAVITEAIFDWPGLGDQLISAINANDWPQIQGILVVIGVSFVIINAAVDLLYRYLNPQVSEQ
ncbi:ABC transporter permease [Salinarchaeum sp. IM2453]|uniref:ABC transporter permease n=1 Tax=Salinarchaeum sp. IM2453 TaxID=2862870 RepID=UPI001C82D329|nr:ABC transporter permease [Salinarchaeum sp. IM2453]QZA88041.1 ABC transporter permease [Salinarchaeum sp. IM2453]